MNTPVVLVHGIWDSAARLEPLRAGLTARGLSRVSAVDLRSSDGSVASRVTYLIDGPGVIQHVFPDVDPGVHAREVLDAIADLPH